MNQANNQDHYYYRASPLPGQRGSSKVDIVNRRPSLRNAKTCSCFVNHIGYRKLDPARGKDSAPQSTSRRRSSNSTENAHLECMWVCAIRLLQFLCGRSCSRSSTENMTTENHFCQLHTLSLVFTQISIERRRTTSPKKKRQNNPGHVGFDPQMMH